MISRRIIRKGQVSGKWKLGDWYSGILEVIYALLPSEAITLQIFGPEGEKNVATKERPLAAKSALALLLLTQEVDG